MHKDFRPLLQKYPENLGNYMDDWWVAMPDDKEGIRLHRQIIHEFLTLMEEKSYFLKALKTQFKRNQMEILGWRVDKDGIRIDPAKISGIVLLVATNDVFAKTAIKHAIKFVKL